MGRGSTPTAASTTTGKAALFIPRIIAASLFQYIRFVRFRQLAFCGRFARRARAPIKHSQKIPLLAGEAGQGALGAGHPPAWLSQRMEALR